jgi:citrate synthase
MARYALNPHKIAHWHEQLKDPLPMFCAGQEYDGEETRDYVDLKDRE